MRFPVQLAPMKLPLPPSQCDCKSVRLCQQVTPEDGQNMSFPSSEPHFAAVV